MSVSQSLAQKLRSLHVPGRPIILTNIWDPYSASIALKSPKVKALATSSFAIAATAGLEDSELTLEENLAAISRISRQLQKEGKARSIPLTVDLQDGYGNRLKEAIEKIIDLGAVGCNIEDSKNINGKTTLLDLYDQLAKIRTVMEVAKAKGVPGFVLNARADCMLTGGTIQDSVDRGNLYLEAGACSVFVFRGDRGLRDAEVRKLADGLGGRLNVIYRKDMKESLSPRELAERGVCRISMGSGLWRLCMATVESEMEIALEGSD